jgi:hypothetical protein
VTMEVHLGKHHSDKFECGLCNLEIGGLENLEIHQNRCEVFQCDWDKEKCKERPNTLIDIKKHFVEVHKKEYGYLLDLKLDRNDYNEVSEKM